MARGGRRVGAGRKPSAAKAAVVLGMDGARFAPGAYVASAAVPNQTGADADLAVPPVDLPAKQKKVWRLWAPRALEQRTLIAATVPGFRELCEQFVVKDVIAKRIGRVGAATAEASNLLKHYEKLTQRVDATLARFKLTAMGKPADGIKKATAGGASSWGAIAAPVGPGARSATPSR